MRPSNTKEVTKGLVHSHFKWQSGCQADYWKSAPHTIPKGQGKIKLFLCLYNFGEQCPLKYLKIKLRKQGPHICTHRNPSIPFTTPRAEISYYPSHTQPQETSVILIEGHN